MRISLKTKAVLLCVISKATFTKTSIKPKFFNTFSSKFSVLQSITRENELRERIPVPYDNYLQFIIFD